jgi:photosystem II stability/assembly factor-like uncharacterized protein
MKRTPVEWVICLAVALCAIPARAAEDVPLETGVLDRLIARPIGPANMGGRVVGLAIVESRPGTFYVATASGGLWKTSNNGTTFVPIFEHQSTASLGAVAVAPSSPDEVWVGTGEANPRNSVSWGDGVCHSADGGKTWSHAGLRESAHIGRILVHPRDPNVVYVAALGRIWGPNSERGLFKTTDCGKTWEQVMYLDDDTGCIDAVMDPTEPETLYIAAYCVRRDAFSGGNPATQFGPKAGLYKTTDGGKTWLRLTNGLPRSPFGRCGLDIYRKDPRILYAVIQTDKTSLNRDTEFGQPARSNPRVETGGVFRSEDGGQTWSKINDLCPRPFYFSQIRVDPNDDQRVYVLGVSLHVSTDGGRSFSDKNGAEGSHADHHALWIDPSDSRHLILGNDGGVAFSYDRSATWERLQNMPLGQFYAVAVDMRNPYRVYGGLQDSGTWMGPSATRSREGITLADWSRVFGYDGFQCQVDPNDHDTLYVESQYGHPRRINLRTGAGKDLQPRAPAKTPEYRFNWNAPLLLSPHDPRVVYFAGNHVFRSVNRGDDWKVVSPDLTRGRPGRNPYMGHTITALAESPVTAGLLYAGTDDGRIHVRRGPGAAWLELSDLVPGVPPDRWITRIECSHFADLTAYLALDRHRNDDRRPYLFKTTDAGATWKPISNNLPSEGPIHVVREDPRNKNLLYVGTEFGLFVSLDAGGSWHRLRGGLPTVAVHDLVIHPRDRELVIGTHGRSVYIVNIAPLQEMTREVLAAPVHLFEVKPATRFQHLGLRWPSRAYSAPNPPFGAVIHYYLGERARGRVHITITDAEGTPVAELKASSAPGLHQVIWDLRQLKDPAAAGEPALVSSGSYQVRLHVGDRVFTRRLEVEGE